MCWNAQISLQTFLVGVIGIMIGVMYGGMSISVAIFCLSISLMQLIEFFVWTYYDNQTVNYSASLAAAALLWIQPVASMLTMANASVRNILLIGYIGLSAVGYLLQMHPSQPPKDYSMTRAANGHLSWNWMSDRTWFSLSSLVVYMIFLFTPILINKQYVLAAIAAGTLGLSLYSYWRENTWGSMWCWIVNGIVLLAVGKAVLR